MIDMSKTYRTRDGREVRIYAVNIGHSLPVHGAYLDEKEWRIWSWWGTGRSQATNTRFDLIEVKPRIQRTLWLALYPNDSTRRTHENLPVGGDCLARVKVEIDCEEGEGL